MSDTQTPLGGRCREVLPHLVGRRGAVVLGLVDGLVLSGGPGPQAELPPPQAAHGSAFRLATPSVRGARRSGPCGGWTGAVIAPSSRRRFLPARGSAARPFPAR
jgi:hypothetical protein